MIWSPYAKVDIRNHITLKQSIDPSELVRALFIWLGVPSTGFLEVVSMLQKVALRDEGDCLFGRLRDDLLEVYLRAAQ